MSFSPGTAEESSAAIGKRPLRVRASFLYNGEVIVTIAKSHTEEEFP